jgi:hypothetical protein
MVLAGSATAVAHHSFAMFAQDKCQELTGTITKFDMKYPHAWMWIEVADAAGKTEVWAFEGSDPASLRVRGWSTALLKKGVKVSVKFNPLVDGRAGGAIQQLKLASGQVLAGTEPIDPDAAPKCGFTADNKP